MVERSRQVKRYVAIGDSQTEGLHDYHASGEPRGWADRFAERLAVDHPGLLYANLAVRGKRVREIREVQLGPALDMRPDLATVVGGINDVLQPGADPEAIEGKVTLQGGAEYRFNAFGQKMFAAVDLQSKQENGWRVNVTAQAGVYLADPEVSWFRRPRVYVEFFDGYSNMGQFWNVRDTYIMLGLGFGM